MTKQERRAYMKAYRLAHKVERAAYYKAYREAHGAELAAQRKIYEQAHRVEHAARTKHWRQAHPSYAKIYRKAHKAEAAARDKVRQRAQKSEITRRKKAWYQAHKAERVAYTKAWSSAHRDNRCDCEARRRARKRGSLVEKISRTLVYRRDGGRCHICGGKVGKHWHLDHIIPLACGGEHCYRNVAVSHAKCNMRKYTNPGAQLRLF